MFSCCCLTYCRPQQLEEALESFLRQTYRGLKELVILNDNPRVKYRFNHPEVRIINLDKRFENMGKKLNASCELCKYPIRVGWPDDDVFLPNALELFSTGMNGSDYYSFFGYWWFAENGKTMWRDDLLHGLIIGKVMR